MPFYRIKSPNYELEKFIKKKYSHENIHLLRDGYMFIYSSFQLERVARLTTSLYEFVDILSESKCRLGDARQLVDESQDPKLKRWFENIGNSIREDSKRNILGQGR